MRLPTPVYLLAGILGVPTSCHREVIPDPELAARKYADAIEAGDADRVYGMLTESSKRDYGPAVTARLIKEDREELRRKAHLLRSEATRVEARAMVTFVDGETAELALQHGRYRVGAAGTLPVAARTVPEALAGLRQALSRRSYPALLRLLSRETQSAIERDLSSLVEGLSDPNALRVTVDGDRAQVEVPGGHLVRLRQRAGVWRIEDFE